MIQLGNKILKENPLGISENFIPSLDPLSIEKLRIVQDMNSVKVDGSIFNSTLSGLADATIFQLVIYVDGYGRLGLKIPKCIVAGPYNIEGKLVKLNIKGSGMLSATLCK